MLGYWLSGVRCRAAGYASRKRDVTHYTGLQMDVFIKTTSPFTLRYVTTVNNSRMANVEEKTN